MVQLFAKELHVDQHGKAINFRLHSLQFPHMRALHLAWLSFMVAFMSWYSIPPLMSIISKELGISSDEVYDSNVTAVAATIIARLFVGPLCERFGPRRVMATLLFIGAIPTALSGLISSGGSLIALRFVIGIMGACFVPCQFWATQMFAPSIVGTANAITGGWGNMGAGVTYLIMPAIYNGIATHIPSWQAWRVVFIIPSGICMLVALCDLFLATDTPHGDWMKLKREQQQQQQDSSQASSTEASSVDEDIVGTKTMQVKTQHVLDKGFPVEEDSNASIKDVKRNETSLEQLRGFCKVLCKPAVLILICHYACSFGTELAIDNVIGQVFEKKFALNPSTAAYIGSIFGLLNICSRFSGGLFSDFLARRMNLQGRILAQLILMCFEGAFLVGFSFAMKTLYEAIILMVCFSFFVQAVCGSTFAIVPFVDPENNGKVMGIIGAGGNFGGLMFNIMFREFDGGFELAFLALGIITLGFGILGVALLRVQQHSIWQLFKSSSTV
ncbi:major facilitator superfamily domain-containing protein [Syncephalastrum racemosum]|uniref:Nitrate/nitrite transporter n=1 Tax=Syncephalastrum racemosum TaxID=13706 RepID=A0A1X2H2J7_SYNRA|nr:major facilitator superfamily domain-containing protein [Syncephalastrum racemosum]